MRHITSLPLLDQVALDRLALRYVERFATTQGRLADYLRRKLRERGWAEEQTADPEGVAAKMVALGYVDDRSYAEAKASSMTRRGLGRRRVADALRAARVGEEDRAAVIEDVQSEALVAALAFARRRRIGPFGAAPVTDISERRRHLAAFARAGHGFALAHRIISALPGDPIEDETDISNHCDDDQPC